eukprot:13338285-Ditylum_brightwellii.AAC.1
MTASGSSISLYNQCITKATNITPLWQHHHEGNATEKKGKSLLKMCRMTYKTKQDREKKRAEEDQAGDRQQQTREKDTAKAQLIAFELKNIKSVSTKK